MASLHALLTQVQKDEGSLDGAGRMTGQALWPIQNGLLLYNLLFLANCWLIVDNSTLRFCVHLDFVVSQTSVHNMHSANHICALYQSSIGCGCINLHFNQSGVKEEIMHPKLNWLWILFLFRTNYINTNVTRYSRDPTSFPLKFDEAFCS